MKLLSTNSLCVEHNVTCHQVFSTLERAGIKPRMATGFGSKTARWWGPEAKAPLVAERARIDANREARQMSRAAAHEAAQAKASTPALAAPKAPASDSVDGVLGDISRQNCVLLGLLNHICDAAALAATRPVAVVFADDDKAALGSLAAQGQGAAVTAADTRALVVTLVHAMAQLTTRATRMEDTLTQLLDAATKPVAVDGRTLEAAIANGRDDPAH